MRLSNGHVRLRIRDSGERNELTNIALAAGFTPAATHVPIGLPDIARGRLLDKAQPYTGKRAAPVAQRPGR